MLLILIVIPFLNNISLSKGFSSLNDSLYSAIKMASKFFLRCFCEGAGHKIFHLNTCLMFLLMSLCKSVVMVFLLYRFGVIDHHCIGFLVSFL